MRIPINLERNAKMPEASNKYKGIVVHKKTLGIKSGRYRLTIKTNNGKPTKNVLIKVSLSILFRHLHSPSDARPKKNKYLQALRIRSGSRPGSIQTSFKINIAFLSGVKGIQELR